MTDGKGPSRHTSPPSRRPITYLTLPASEQPGGTRRHVFDLKNAVLASQIFPGPIVSDLAGGGKPKRECGRRVTPVKQADHEVVRQLKEPSLHGLIEELSRK